MSDEAARRDAIQHNDDFQGIPGLVTVRRRFSSEAEASLGEFGGYQAVFRYPNGWGASVINGLGAYGVELLAVGWDSEDAADDDFRLAPPGTPSQYQNDVGWLDRESLEQHLLRISSWPSRYRTGLHDVLRWLTPKVEFYPEHGNGDRDR